MEIDRKMASYLLEIKRRLPRSQQSAFRLTASNLEGLVIDIKASTNDEVVKKLASSFLREASIKRGKLDQQRQEAIQNKSFSHFVQSNSDKNERIIVLQSDGEDEDFADFLELKDFPNLSKFEGFEEFLEPDALANVNTLGHQSKSDKNQEADKSAAFSKTKRDARLRSKLLHGSNLRKRNMPLIHNRASLQREIKALINKTVIVFTTPIELTSPIRFVRKSDNASK